MSRKLRASEKENEAFASIIVHWLKTGDGQPFISFERAKTMSIAEIIAEFYARTQRDHVIPVAIAREAGWDKDRINHVSNIQYLTLEGDKGHGAKTSRDRKDIAKTTRVRVEHEAFRARVLAKTSCADEVAKTTTSKTSKIPSRPFPKAPDDTKFDWKSGRRVAKD